MKTKNTILLAAICAALSSNAFGQMAREAGNVGNPIGFSAPAGAAVVLFDQTDNAAGNGAPAQNFEDAFNAYDSDAADDFEFVSASGWTIQQLNFVTTTGGNAPTVDVSIHANSPGGGDPDLPGAAICNYPGVVPTSPGASLQVTLPAPCILPSGRYWVRMTANQDFAAAGQRFWSNRTTQSFSEAAWRNPGDGFGTGCTAFAPQTSCGVGGGTSPDFLFQVVGVVGGLGADVFAGLAAAPSPVVAGTNLTYTATATNNGPADASDVSISLPLPAGTSFVSVTPSAGGSCNAASPVVCTWAGATPNTGVRTATIVAAVAPSAANGSTLSATLTASSTSSETDPTNNTASAMTGVSTSADLVLAFTATPATVAPGLGITYTATSTNNGPSDAQDQQISIALGAGVLFSSATPSAGGSCTLPAANSTGTASCTWAGGNPPGTVRTLSVLGYSYNNGAATANATTSSTTSDPTPGNNALVGSVTVQRGGGITPPTMIPTADRGVLAILAVLFGLLGFAAVRRQS